MNYEIHHRTTYTYEEPVTISHHLARLAPCDDKLQALQWHEVDIDPPPVSLHGHTDYFGNKVLFFALRGAHRTLTVKAHSRVSVSSKPTPDPQRTPPWEMLRDDCRVNILTPDAEAGEFSFASRLIKPSPQFAAYAARSFTPGRTVLEAAIHLNGRIFRELAFDPKATDVATPVEEAFNKRRGVCQDFAHIFIACVRSIGLPARYVSGYLETLPPPGKPKMIGADASHAWVSIWCGEATGWVDLDPTNDCLPAERHVKVAHGRDFSDVSPLRGVVVGPGAHTMEYAVDVNAIP
jgi:transglutaminase-like putative cysteine protease